MTFHECPCQTLQEVQDATEQGLQCMQCVIPNICRHLIIRYSHKLSWVSSSIFAAHHILVHQGHPDMPPTGKHTGKTTHKSCRDEAWTQADQADVFLMQWFCRSAHKLSQASLCRTIHLWAHKCCLRAPQNIVLAGLP